MEILNVIDVHVQYYTIQVTAFTSKTKKYCLCLFERKEERGEPKQRLAHSSGTCGKQIFDMKNFETCTILLAILRPSAAIRIRQNAARNNLR